MATPVIDEYVPCKCGSSDTVVRHIADMTSLTGERYAIECRSCNQAVVGTSKVEVVKSWCAANPKTQPEPLKAVAGPGEFGFEAIVYTDLARAAVLLRELADILDRRALVR